MRKNQLVFSLIAVSILSISILGSQEAEASHFRFGHLNWEEDPNSPLTVTFGGNQAWREGSLGSDDVGEIVQSGQLNFGDGSTPIFVKVEAVNLADDWMFGKIVDSSGNPIKHTYPNEGPFTAGFSSCCRISGLQNTGDTSFTVETIVDLRNNNSQSPKSAIPPIVFVPANESAATFLVPAIDADGDSLSFRKSTSSESGISSQTFYSLDESTGIGTLSTIGKSIGTMWAASVTIEEDLNPNMGKVMVDFIIQVGSATIPPEFVDPTPSAGTEFEIPVGKPFSFNLKCQDLADNDTVTIDGLSLPQGSTLTPSSPTGTPYATGTFNWTPESIQVAAMTFTCRDQNLGSASPVPITIRVVESAPPVCEEPEQLSAFFDFNDGVPEEASGITTTEPVQGFQNHGFDGNFLRNPSTLQSPTAANTTFTFSDLPTHDSIDISFLLAAIDSWDSDNGGCCSPDNFNVSVDGVTVFTSTHNNALGTNDYANENPDAVLVYQEQLGWRNDQFGKDSGYDLSKEPALKGIPHTADTLTIDFFASGEGWQGDPDGYDESWAIDNLQVTTNLSQPICAPEPDVRKKNAGDNQWDTRPTFGISHEDRKNQVVENGFRFNNNQFTLTDNHWTPFEEQSIEIGTVNSFSATVYADKQLKIQEFLFGIPNVGEAEKAELGVEVWYDFNGEIQDVKVVQKSNVIDADTITISHEKVKCLSNDSEEKCDNTTVSMKFLEPLKDKVMAIKAIDFKNRDQRTFLNEGFDISGKSLNPMQSKMIPSNTRDTGLVQVTQLEKYSPYWVADDGRMFEMNSFGSFKQINQKFERFQDDGDARTRAHSGFGGIIEYEKNRASQVFDASMFISELPDSFGHHIVIHDRMTDELKQNMLQQEQIAKGILEQMEKQTRYN